MTTPDFTASTFLVVAFIAVVAGTLTGLVAWLRLAARTGALSPRSVRPVLGALAAWMVVAGGLSLAGVLHSEAFPPPLMILLWIAAAGVVAVVAVPRSRRAIVAAPLWATVLLQCFRLPLELVMHRASVESVMPAPMSFDGRNFDIVTGALALVLGLWLWSRERAGKEPPRAAVWAYNLVGIGLLVNVIVVAVMCMPGPMQRIVTDPPNVWVTYLPFVYLPAVLVPLALWGHLSTFAWLLHDRADRADRANRAEAS